MSVRIQFTPEEIDVLDDMLSYVSSVDSLDKNALGLDDEDWGSLFASWQSKRVALKSVINKVNKHREKQDAVVY
jgi:hypothetical protein